MNNQQLIDAGLNLLGQISPDSPTAVSSQAILQRLDNHASKLAAYLITQPQTPGAVAQTDLLQLIQKLESTFNEAELQDLSFRLQVDYENISGQTRSQKVRELVSHLNRRGRLVDLTTVGTELRPNLNWQTEVPTRHNQPIVSKVDLAVVVDVARPALMNVAQYLDQRGAPANFLILRHVQPGAFFAPEDSWEAITLTFGDVVDRMQREFAGAQFHFFLAGPGALLFALGCVWGTVYEAAVYHFENNTYYPVLSTSRRLRHVASGWQ